MRSTNSTKETIKQWLHVSASPETRTRIWREVLFVQEQSGKTKSALIRPNIWRTIMKNPLTKIAAMTVIIIAVLFLITFFDKAATPAYALEQTIEANHTIKTVHLRMFEDGRSIENNEFSDYWIKYDDAGKLSNLRCNEHDKDGVWFTVWNEGIKKTWIPENNVVIVNRLNNTAKDTAKKWEDFAKECDPKLFLQWLYDQSKEEEAIEIKIDEPAEDSNSIYVKATHSVHKFRMELVVDRKTKLIKKLSMYRLREHGDELNAQVEYLAYNQPIDPSMFELSGIPDNAKVIDRVEGGIIIPGLRVGDYTLGMSEDDMLNKLGEPGGMYFVTDDGVIKEISVRSPLYKFANGLGVGDSEEKIKQAFGNDFQLEEFEPKALLTYEDKGLQFEIHKQNRTVREITVVRSHGDSDTPDSVKSITPNEQPPGPITFPKIDRRPKPALWGRGEMKSLPKYDSNLDRAWQVDLRCYDLSKLDLRNSIDDLLYAHFDDRTVWPAPNQMPSDFNWQTIMELGMNPGLGIRSLHKKGITGHGVGIAILDQQLLVDHQEYVERLRLYEEIDLQGRTEPQMHGATIASIAVGKTVGVAPEAELYYIAQSNFGRKDGNFAWDFTSLAQGVQRILEVNEQLPKDKKIRVISISMGWRPSDISYKEITEAAQKAKEAGMLVICSSVDQIHGFSFHGLGRHPLADPDVFESYESCLRGWPKKYDDVRSRYSEHLLVPMDSRTTASHLGIDEYVFYREGGWSWSIPYIAGVYALAAQVEPDITPERFWSLAMKTGRTIELENKGKKIPFGPILDPVKLIDAIKQ